MHKTESKPLRIGLVTPAWPGSNTANGIATATRHLAGGLETIGHEVTIITFEIDAPDDFPRTVILPSLRWRLFDTLRYRFGINQQKLVHYDLGRRIAAAAQEAIQRHGIEVLVMEETQGWASIVSRYIPIPIVITLHGPWCLHKTIHGSSDAKADARREAREIKGLKHAKAITAPSDDALRRTAALWALPNIPQAVIHNPMPILLASEDKASLERLLFVGRFDFHKGGDVVIEAFAEIACKHPTCRLTFVGPDIGVKRPGDAPLRLSEALSRLPEYVRERIDIRGHCSRDEIVRLRRSHGIAIVASRYETFGGTIAEAMAAGSALVCTRVGGGEEILSDEHTALLVAPEDPQAIAQACLRLLADPLLAQSLGSAAQAYVKDYLSPENIGRQMAEFLTPLCAV